MLRRATQIAVMAMAVVAVLSDIGYPVASLLAGLGIGGLALAFAAQKTLENLFGSVSISVDRPFQVGDFVRVEGGLVGTVEELGLRSTRIRTLDRTVVTIPNGKLADQRIETFAARDRCRLFFPMGLVYSTTAEQMRAVLSGVDALLRGHPRAWPDGIGVRFVGLSPSSLDVEVVAWFDTANWDEFQAIRQDLLLGVMDVVERAGTAFAYPTQTVLLAGKNGGPARVEVDR
jgi:MscS family membrane protein